MPWTRTPPSKAASRYGHPNESFSVLAVSFDMASAVVHGGAVPTSHGSGFPLFPPFPLAARGWFGRCCWPGCQSFWEGIHAIVVRGRMREICDDKQPKIACVGCAIGGTLRGCKEQLLFSHPRPGASFLWRSEWLFCFRQKIQQFKSRARNCTFCTAAFSSAPRTNRVASEVPYLKT